MLFLLVYRERGILLCIHMVTAYPHPIGNLKCMIARKNNNVNTNIAAVITTRARHSNLVCRLCGGTYLVESGIFIAPSVRLYVIIAYPHKGVNS